MVVIVESHEELVGGIKEVDTEQLEELTTHTSPIQPWTQHSNTGGGFQTRGSPLQSTSYLPSSPLKDMENFLHQSLEEKPLVARLACTQNNNTITSMGVADNKVPYDSTYTVNSL